MMSDSFMIMSSSPSSLISVPDHLPNSTRSPTLTSSGRISPSSERAPGPTATTSPSIGFSLAVSGMMMPPAVLPSSATRRTSTRSCSGRNFIESLLAKAVEATARSGHRGSGVGVEHGPVRRHDQVDCRSAVVSRESGLPRGSVHLARIDPSDLTPDRAARLRGQEDRCRYSPVSGKRQALEQLLIDLYRVGPRRLHLDHAAHGEGSLECDRHAAGANRHRVIPPM